MPERSDNYTDLTPHHRRKPSKIEKKAQKWAEEKGITDTNLIEAFIEGYTKCEDENKGKLFTIEEIKEIMN
jgi:hypothetical protein